MVAKKKKAQDSKPLLSQGIREWLASSTEISSVGGLAVAVGEPADSFRVRLSRNRWSRKILERLIKETNLADSVDKLCARYSFEISERTTRQYTVNRTQDEFRRRVYNLTADDPQARQLILNAHLSSEELDYVTACRCSQRQIPDELKKLVASEKAKLVLIGNAPELENSAADISLHTRLYNPTLRRHLTDALAANRGVEIHFLREYPAEANEEEHKKLLTGKWSEFVASFDVNVSGMLRGHLRFVEPGTWLGVAYWHWIHLVPPLHYTAWALFENEELHGKLQEIESPWTYSILASPISREAILRTLKRLHYKLSHPEGWTYEPVYDPEQGRREYPLS